MGLENYRDLSNSGSDLGAGFQFEFYCSNCSRKWKSPFKPYRKGQLGGFLKTFGFLFGNTLSASRVTAGAAEYGSRDAKSEALRDAMKQAETMFSNCVNCENGFCEDCLDSSGVCVPCRTKAKAGVGTGHGSAVAQSASGGHACPNCGTAGNGGRFCAECGFDMASTHKSCPGCGAVSDRAARFCGDCGHGF